MMYDSSLVGKIWETGHRIIKEMHYLVYITNSDPLQPDK